MSYRTQQMALAFDRRRKDIIYRKPETRRQRNRLPPVEPRKERLVSSGELDKELLPGIANDVTFIYIISKLPWRAILTLSSVCRDWNRELRAGHHRHYDERVRSKSTETLAVVAVTLPDGSHAIALYSVRDERFYYVPPIPCFRGFPSSYECVSLDGKLYVLGGLNYSGREAIYKEVYVLDLVGERRWRQCASRRERREKYACVAVDGKIYVHGGKSGYEGEELISAEVYDPKLNSWSLSQDNWGIARCQHRITVVGEELVLHGGGSCNRNFQAYVMWKLGHGGDSDFDTFRVQHPLSKCVQNSRLLEFYNPVTKNYKILYPYNSRERDIVSGTQGSFSSISWHDIQTYHLGDTIPHVRSFSNENVLPPHMEVDHYSEEPLIVTVAEDELLALVHWFDKETFERGSSLVRSRGYSTEHSQPISWEKARSSWKHSHFGIECIKCSIQL